MRYLIAILALSFVVSGCATTGASSKTGFGMINMAKEAGMATSDVSRAKQGKACSQNYLGVFAGGDSTIEAAKRAGGITKVSTVDYEFFNVLGFYGQVCTLVVGQ